MWIGWLIEGRALAIQSLVAEVGNWNMECWGRKMRLSKMLRDPNLRNPIHTVFSVRVELITSIESIVRWWKEYFGRSPQSQQHVFRGGRARGLWAGLVHHWGRHCLQAIQSLFCQSQSLFRIASSNSDWFPARDGLPQGCPLSLVLFIIFMDRISRHSQTEEEFGFHGLRILSLLFADDVVLLVSLNSDLQLSLGWFAAECEGQG